MAKVSIGKRKIKILTCSQSSPFFRSTASRWLAQILSTTKRRYLKMNFFEAAGKMLTSLVSVLAQTSPKKLRWLKAGCSWLFLYWYFNQVNLQAAAKRAVPCSSHDRSQTLYAAELPWSGSTVTARHPERTLLLTVASGKKSADNFYEARGKAFRYYWLRSLVLSWVLLLKPGMRVYFYDIENKLSLGNATQVHTMTDLLNKCDVISLHVPETNETKNMMGKEEFDRMKPGSIFINGRSWHCCWYPCSAWCSRFWSPAGAANDVFPTESKPMQTHLSHHDVVRITWFLPLMWVVQHRKKHKRIIGGRSVFGKLAKYLW